MELFKLFGTIGLNGVDEANSGIDSVTGNAKDSSSKLGSAFKKIGSAIAAYFAVDKIVSFGKEIVNTAATVDAETSAFEQIMGNYSDSARDKLNAVADSTGVMSTRMQSHFTSLSAKFKGLGFDVTEATDLAQRGLTLAADASAFWDVSLDESSSHLNSFINGSYEGGEAIGLFANDTQMAMYAVQEGLVESTKEWSSLDEATKQATRLEYAENMFAQSGATGQAAREAGQYANVQANLNEKWRQFKAEIGEPLLQNVVIPAMEILSGLVDTLSEAWDVLSGKVELSNSKFAGLEPTINKVKDAFNAAKDKAIEIINTLKEIFAPVIETISNSITENVPKWKESFDKFKESLAELQPVWELIGGVIVAVVGVILSVVNGLINAFSGMIDTLSGVITFIGGFFDMFLGLITGNSERIQEGWQTMSDGSIAIFEGLWDTLIGFLQGFIDGFVSFLEGLGVDVDGILQGISDGFNSFIDWIVTAFNDVKQFFVDVWTGITTFLSDAWETIKNVVEVGIMFIGSYLEAAWNIITLPFQFIWENCKDTVITIWEAIKTAVSNAVNAVKDVITTVFNAVKDFITPVVNGIKTAVTNAWNAIKSVTSTAFNAVKSVATNIWNGIKSAIETVVNTIKTTVTNVFNAIKTAISTPLNAAKSTVSSIFDNIKSKIKSAIEGARDIVKNAIDKIKSFFNFSWSLPKLKLPHFSISGKFSLDPPSVPKLAVDWYKKGGILTQPTAFGINPKTGALRVGGEAGDEAVAPIDALLGYVRTAVQEETGDIAYTVQRLIDMLADYFPQILSNMDQAVVLDDGTLVGRIAPKMNMRLNDIQAANARGR